MQAISSRLERAMDVGGVTGAIVRSYDWSRTPLGPMAAWSATLQGAVSNCLSTSFPMVVNWGDKLIQIYNDAALNMFGPMHPHAMARPARTNFPEFWEHSPIEHIVKRIHETAFPFDGRDARVLVNRHGLLEEAYFTFSLSPILDEDGTVGGILNTYVEMTACTLTRRRMRTLRRLSQRALRARKATDACADAVAVLATDPYDLRFVLLYLASGDGASFTLAGVTGIPAREPAAPNVLVANAREESFAWPFEQVLRTGKAVEVTDLPSKIDLGARPDRTTPPRDALVLPLVEQSNVGPPCDALVLPIARSSNAGPMGILIVGLSPRLPLDDAYRGFLHLLAAQIAAAIRSAEAYEAANERAEELAEIDRAKRVFYSNISHEFRTPLTLLLGPVEDLLREDTLTPAQREQLLAVQRNALRLLRIVSGLLDLARIESGGVDMRSEPTELGAFTRGLASAFDSATSAAGLRFVVDCPSLPQTVHMDRSIWETIVLNLLSNALKYTPRGGIRLTLRATDGRVRLTVQDTGIGIPAPVLPHIFDRFYRVPRSEGRSIEGTGIGLALVRELVRALGGDVGVTSVPGAGSTFTVEIPSDGPPRRVPIPADRERSARDGGDRAPFAQESKAWIPRVKPETQAPTERSAPRPRVLVVEDNPEMRLYITRVLALDCEVQAVDDGFAALEAAFASAPDLVVSDVLMPGLDGLALVRALRSDPRTRAIPMLLLTGCAGEDAALAGLGSGADDYVVKPFSSRELRARVHTHLELAQMRRRATESETKDAFIGVASHELRTPITTLKLQVELLSREARRTMPSADARLESIRRAIGRMEGLVEDLLGLSAIKCGVLTLRRERADLVSLCKLAADEQALIAQRRVSVDLPSHPVLADVDPRRIQQVVTDLLSNALKYTPPDKPVALRLRRTDGEAVVSVRDEGPGIPADALPHLFERFYRVRGAEVTTGSAVGLGLGLFVSEAIVRGHGGHIDVQSEVGSGSTFSVRLPLSA